MKKVIIQRFLVGPQYSLGHAYIQHPSGIVEFIGASLERGWVDNQKGVSCVPEGIYPLKLEYSPKFKKDLWELYGVPNRSECKFHVANYWYELNGCIALGRKHKNLDNDKIPDVTSSRNVMNEFEAILSGQVESEVKVKNIIF